MRRVSYILSIPKQSMPTLEKFLAGVFPAERKIPRRTKDKNTLDVDVFGVIYRHHWVHSRFFRHRSMIVQFATV
jgi:hypothetical protein